MTTGVANLGLCFLSPDTLKKKKREGGGAGRIIDCLSNLIGVSRIYIIFLSTS